MAIEDDVSSLQQQVSQLQQSFNSLNSTITNLNNSLSSLQSSVNTANNNITNLQSSIATTNNNITDLQNNKSNLDSPVFTGYPQSITPGSNSSDDSIATTKYVTNKISESGPSDSIPLQLGPITDGIFDNENYIEPSSAGSAGLSIKPSREDHVHPGDTTRAPLDSPIFYGVPQSAYTPAIDSEDGNSAILANTSFVMAACKAIKEDITGMISGGSSDSGSSDTAETPGEPGGNSENLNKGGGSTGGVGGAGGGDNGQDGGKGTTGIAEVWCIPATDNLNWDIATYVHTP